jgi:hypothetical protein
VCQIGNEKAASEEKENPERFHLSVPVSKHGGGLELPARTEATRIE